MALLALDLGTTGVRALIVTPEGDRLGNREIEVEIANPADGLAEQSLEVYWQAAARAIRGALEASELAAADIAAIGFSHQRCTFALAGTDRQPLTNLIVWMDQRGVPELDFIRDRVDPAHYYDTIGLPIYYIASLSKLLWFAHQQPQVYAAAQRVWPIANFFMVRMGVDDPPIDHATASFYGLLDTRRREWSTNVINALDLDASKLPALVPPGTQIGTLQNRHAAQELGLTVGTPLVIGGGDQQCAAFGSGMIEPGQSLINLGTATAIMAAVGGPLRDQSHTIPSVCHAVPGQWEMEGHTQASGIILRRFRDEFATAETSVAARVGQDVYALLSDEASRAAAGARGLIFLPTLNGTTAPINYPYSSGVLLGLRVTHTRADLLRAMMEGMCFESRWILDHMATSGAPVETVYLSGGGSKSPFWCQVHADILQRPITRVRTSNAAAIGAAICAGLGAGIFASAQEGLAALSQTAESYQPNPNLQTLYERQYNVFKEAYSTLYESELFYKLHNLTQ